MVMKEARPHERICPICGKKYSAFPTLSRTDNETLICPDCGTRQALMTIGISEEEQNAILATIHRYSDKIEN